jgi:Ca2+-binding RTX toxin-like protein
MATSMMTTRETALITAAALGLNTEGTAENDTLLGGADDDFLSGLGGADLLSGLGGNDTLSGGTGNDKLEGSTGNDTLYGGGGTDRLFAGDGDDLLLGGIDNDGVFGGAGNDTVSYQGILTGGVQVSLRSNTSGGAYGVDQLASIENIIGNAGNDTLEGSDFGNQIDGNAGDDRLLGRFGNDTIIGGDGADSLNGGRGVDVLYGGAGDDVLTGSTGKDGMFGGEGADQFLFKPFINVGNDDTVGDFEVGVDKLALAEVPVGGEDPAIAFAPGEDGATVVTVGDPADPLYVIAVTTTGGTLTADDILFL